MQINKNFVHQVGEQTWLYYDARSTSHQELSVLINVDNDQALSTNIIKQGKMLLFIV